MHATRSVIRAGLAILLSLGFANVGHGIPIRYVATFTVDSGFNTSALLDLQTPPFPGAQYYAYITVDDSFLSSGTGIVPVRPLSFIAQVGDTIWDMNDRSSEFVGFRGECPDRPDIWGCFSPNLGFGMENGQPTQLYGGVYGISDLPFIDFRGERFNSWSYFSCLPEHCVPNRRGVALYGTISITALPEPATLALLLACIGAIAVTRRHYPSSRS